MLDGIGVFGIILGQDFARSGFMHSSLYLLLRKLISSSAQIRIASDAVLRTLAAAGGYSTVIDRLISCNILYHHRKNSNLCFSSCAGWPIRCGECRLHC